MSPWEWYRLLALEADARDLCGAYRESVLEHCKPDMIPRTAVQNLLLPCNYRSHRIRFSDQRYAMVIRCSKKHSIDVAISFIRH